MKEFKVNEYITLKLEEGETNIYVKDQLFNQCRFLLIDIPIDKISFFDELDSIDEAAEKLDRSQEPRANIHGELHRSDIIPPEVEFWGHCSNLQVWYENNYDTRLLHSNLAFPLLKKLTEAGDPMAKKIFKEEIAKRLEMGYIPVNKFLINEDYLDFLENEELDIILENPKLDLVNLLESLIKEENGGHFLSRIKKISREIYKDILVKLIKGSNPTVLNFLAKWGNLKQLSDEDIRGFLKELDFNFIDYMNQYSGKYSEDYCFGIIELLNRIRKISYDHFKEKLLFLYENGNSNLIEYLNSLNFDEYISRAEFYNCILKRDYAKAMLELEKELNTHFLLVVEDSLGYGTNCEYSIENKVIFGISINESELVLKLTEFPQSIFRLTSLKKLYLINTHINFLTEDINRLELLEELEIINTPLKFLPESIGDLRNLKNLYLNDIKLEIIPKNIKKLPKKIQAYINSKINN